MLIVAITAGYRGWIWWQERKAAQAGDRFMAALAEIESGDRAEGEAELAAIAADCDAGYSALARLRLAGEKAGAGDKPEALAAYDAVAADSCGSRSRCATSPGSGRRCWRSTPATSPARRSGRSRSTSPATPGGMRRAR